MLALAFLHTVHPPANDINHFTAVDMVGGKESGDKGYTVGDYIGIMETTSQTLHSPVRQILVALLKGGGGGVHGTACDTQLL